MVDLAPPHSVLLSRVRIGYLCVPGVLPSFSLLSVQSLCPRLTIHKQEDSIAFDFPSTEALTQFSLMIDRFLSFLLTATDVIDDSKVVKLRDRDVQIPRLTGFGRQSANTEMTTNWRLTVYYAVENTESFCHK
jgi:hypothetical protein